MLLAAHGFQRRSMSISNATRGLEQLDCLFAIAEFLVQIAHAIEGLGELHI